MALRYAKAAGGNWNAAATWSATSAAGVDNAGVPTSADDVIFELASGNITIDAAASCRSLDCTSGVGSYTGTLTHGAFTLSVGTSTVVASNVALKFSTGMTYVTGNSISFVSTSSTQTTITTAGKGLAAMTFNGVGGKWQLLDATTSSSTISLTNGALDTNGINHNWGKFQVNAGIKTLTIGSSVITLTGIGTPFSNANSGNLTVTANTGTFQSAVTSTTFTLVSGTATN